VEMHKSVAPLPRQPHHLFETVERERERKAPRKKAIELPTPLQPTHPFATNVL